MAPTKSQILAEYAAKLDAALIDPNLVDKRHIITQIGEVVAVTQTGGSGGSGGSATSPTDITQGIDSSTDIEAIRSSLADIAAKALSLPQQADIVLPPGAVHPLPSNCVTILGLFVTYPTAEVCRLHLIANANIIISVFNYRPVRLDPLWGHVLIADRSAMLPCWLPSSASIANNNAQSVTLKIIYQNLP